MICLQTGKRFFVHYFAPVDIVPYPKSVLFLLDTSGSMQGPKIANTKSAMVAILESLGAADTFNIITFSTWLRFWKQDGMSGVSPATINEAKTFVNDISVSGGKLCTWQVKPSLCQCDHITVPYIHMLHHPSIPSAYFTS